MHIVIGCDNAAIRLKSIIVDLLREKGIEVEDVGCNSSDDQTAYPLIAKRVCQRIIQSNYAYRGILICGTGIGMCMCANKFKGIRAAICHDVFSTRRSILSNNGNVLCIGKRVIGVELAKALVSEWLSLSFVDGASTQKVQEIGNLETENMK